MIWWLKLNPELLCLSLATLSLLSLFPSFTQAGNYCDGKHETVQFRRGRGDYYYSSISSPNFPNEFSVPYCKFYKINVASLDGFDERGPVINIYFPELFPMSVIRGSRELDWIRIFQGNTSRPVTSGTKAHSFAIKRVDEVVEVQVFIKNHHHYLRTKLHFHQIFGFNMSIEVVDEKRAKLLPVDRSCTIRGCSYAGRCRSFLGEFGLDFRCECLKGYSGSHCQYGPECNPQKGINFCLNGGTCRMYGAAGGRCECPQGFEGFKCQLHKKYINFVDSNKECSRPSPISTQLPGPVTERPCSTCRTFPKGKGWNRYIISIDAAMWYNYTTEIFQPLFEEYFTPPMDVPPPLNVERNYVEVYGKLKSASSKIKIPKGVSFKLSNGVKSSKDEILLQPTISMNKENEKPLREGHQFSLTCIAKIPPNTTHPNSVIRFRWFKDLVPIREAYTTRHISKFEVPDKSGMQVLSILMIYNISPFDMGIFTCQVTDLLRNVQECADYPMLVVVPPQIEVLPMSVTLIKNQSKILMCSDSLEAVGSGSQDGLRIEWFKDGELVRGNHPLYANETIYPQGQILRIRDANESATFTCRAINKGGVKEKSVLVRVLEPSASPYDYCSDVCEKVEITGTTMKWGLTAINQTAMILCPEGFFGYAQKTCLQGPDFQGKWDDTDFSRCTHSDLRRFNYTLRSMQNGYNVQSNGLGALHLELQKYLTGRSRSSNGTKLMHGEGDKYIHMLVDTINYVRQIAAKSPHLLLKDHVYGLLTVTDNFISFRNSCAHQSSVDELLRDFLQFVKGFDISFFEGKDVFVGKKPIECHQTLQLNSTKGLLNPQPTNSTRAFSSAEIDMNTSTVVYHWRTVPESTEDETEKERLISVVKISGLMHLNGNDKLISDVVALNVTSITEAPCNLEASHFEIRFHINDTSSRNKTCAGFYNSKWDVNICMINVTLSVVTCVCKEGGTYAVMALEEELPFKPMVAAFIKFPPDWIAKSGCMICLVLCAKTLIRGLLKRIFEPYFVLTSAGMVSTSLALLYIVRWDESRKMEVFYMIITLGLQSIRIWQMIWTCGNVREVCPWLEQVSKWILLAAINITELLPLFTVYVVDTLCNGKGSVLMQNSVVLITFCTLFAASVMMIFLLYYKTYLRLHKKSATNNNLQGDHRSLNETFCLTVIHMVQVLSVILFVNLRQLEFFHYLFALFTTLLGLAWFTPTKGTGKRRNNDLADVSTPLQLPVNGMTTSLGGYDLSKLELTTPLQDVPMNRVPDKRFEHWISRQSRMDDDEDNDPVTIETTTSINSRSNNSIVVSSVSGNSRGGSCDIRPYLGQLPENVKCHLRLDDGYVLPNQ